MKSKLSIIFFISVLWSVSCKDGLETSPTTAVVDSEVYKTTDNVQTVINGTWRYLNDTYFTYANPGYSAFMRASDAMGSDVAITTKYGSRDTYTFAEMINNRTTRVRAFWTLLYKVIDNANNVIARVDEAVGSQTSKDILKGQAKVLRSFAYLNLASFYQFSYLKDKKALTAPIYTQPSNTETKGNPKASLEQMYELIFEDLTEAVKLLSTYERGNEKFKINKDVVQGLLARAYLNVGEWELAAQSAAKASKEYPLMSESEYKEGFNDLQNQEWIWGHLQTNDQSTASYTFHYMDVSSPGSYYYSFMADPYFKDLFNEQDIRYQLFEWDGQVGREGFLKYDKFRFKPSLIGDILYMRASEMLLIEAEGYARAQKKDKAVEALNKLRKARNTPIYVEGGTAELIDEILIERRKELWGEGFALSDIIRTQGKVSRKEFIDDAGVPIQVEVVTPEGERKIVSGQGHRVVKFPDGSDFVPNSPYYLFSIPFEEFTQNPNL